MTDTENTLSRNSVLVALGVVVVTGVVGVVASPANTVQILGFCSGICVCLFGLMKIDTAAREVKEVKQTIAAVTTVVDSKLTAAAGKLDEMAVVGKKAESLANSAHGVSLKLNARLLRKEADRTQRAEDIKEAEGAEKQSDDHEAAQRRVDAKFPPTKPAAPAQPLGEVISDVKEVVVEVKDAVKDVKAMTKKSGEQ